MRTLKRPLPSDPQPVWDAYWAKVDRKELQVSFPDLETQAQRIWARQGAPRSYRYASVTEALGVPSILSAVSLISATVGRLSLDGYQNGTRVVDRSKIPQVMVRPNPLTTPREFFLKTAYYMASRGEFWWFVAHRDSDGNADALFPVPPWEIVVQPNPANRLAPTIYWTTLGKTATVPRENLRHQIYLPDPKDPAGVRGVGPLQLAGAAVSVAVEADAWAGNFFSGRLPSMVGTTEQDLDEGDLKRLDQQWGEKDNNLPRWMTMGMKLEPPPFDAQKAQLTESRNFQVGEVARMFDMPGPLLEFVQRGSSLTYRNESDIWMDFQQRCLSPHYLEPIEQEMSDLLVRNLTSRFSTWELTKADILTRYQAYQIGIGSGIYGPEYPQQMEGLASGDVNYAPVAPAPPSALPAPIPGGNAVQMSLSEPVRCPNGHLLAEQASPPYRFTCFRCKQVVSAEAQPTNQIEQLALLLATRQTAPAVNPQITFASPDLSAMEELAEQSRQSNQTMREAVEEVRLLASREQPAPVIEAPPAPNVEVTVQTKPFVDAINSLRELMVAPRTRTVIRDEDNNIIGSKEEIA